MKRKNEPLNKTIAFAVSTDDLQRFNAILCAKNLSASEYMRELLHKAFEKEGV